MNVKTVGVFFKNQDCPERKKCEERKIGNIHLIVERNTLKYQILPISIRNIQVPSMIFLGINLL